MRQLLFSIAHSRARGCDVVPAEYSASFERIDEGLRSSDSTGALNFARRIQEVPKLPTGWMFMMPRLVLTPC
jgi:hypothetical protein